MKKLTNAEIVGILRKVRRLLNKGWTQKTFARNKWGNIVSFFSKSACKFCLGGAIRRVTDPTGSDTCEKIAAFHTILNIVAGEIHYNVHYNVAQFNDMQPRTKQGKANVLRLVDELIEKYSK